MNIIEAPSGRSTVTTVTIDLAQLPELSAFDRLALRLSLALITRIEQDAARERARSAHAERAARAEREWHAERLLLLTLARR